jgi:hypothetical protein
VPKRTTPLDEYVLSFNPRFWFRADNVVTLTGSVTYMQNIVGSDRMWVTGTLPVSGSNALFNGMPTFSFEGTQWADSSLPASSHAFEHDGSGVTIASVYRVRNNNGSIIAQTNHLTVTSGFQFTGQGWAVQSGSAAVVGLSVTSPLNVPSWKVGTHATSAVPNAQMIRNGILQTTANNLQTPAAENPAHTLRLGAYSNGTGQFAGDLADFIVVPSSLTPLAIDSLRRYVAGRYGF